MKRSQVHLSRIPCCRSFARRLSLETQNRVNSRPDLQSQGQTRSPITVDRSPRTHILVMQVTDTNACLGAPCLCSESSWILQLTIAFPAKALEVPYS